jgi:hypothetical protein
MNKKEKLNITVRNEKNDPKNLIEKLDPKKERKLQKGRTTAYSFFGFSPPSFDYEQMSEALRVKIVTTLGEACKSGVTQKELSDFLGTSTPEINFYKKGTRTGRGIRFANFIRMLHKLRTDITAYLPPGLISFNGLPVIPYFDENKWCQNFFSTVPDTMLPVLPQYFHVGIVAVKVGTDSMEPTVPKDAVIGLLPYDGKDDSLEPNSIVLVEIEPFGRLLYRVSMGNKREIIFAPNNEAFTPLKFSQDEFYDKNIFKIVVGKVSWIWSN